MKRIVIKCDYCKTEIKEGNPNTIVDGKGNIKIPLESDHIQKTAVLLVKLKSMTDKNLTKDICNKCIAKFLKEGLDETNI